MGEKWKLQICNVYSYAYDTHYSGDCRASEELARGDVTARLHGRKDSPSMAQLWKENHNVSS